MTGRIGVAALIVAGAIVFAARHSPATAIAAADAGVQLLRLPAGGLQPMAEFDADGTMHVTYFAGSPNAGDVFYVTKRPDAQGFSAPIRVNTQPGSAIATGTIRGPHMTLGRNGRVHVAWMGSSKAQPRGPNDAAPMLYTRLPASGGKFEPERNVVQQAYGLDGGGTVVADTTGRVYVLWHAGPVQMGEEHRRVVIAQSLDDGATFARDVAIATQPGVCACCGMKALLDARGVLRVLYRAFSPPDNRDMYLLTSRGSSLDFDRRLLEKWQLGACPLSTTSATMTDDGIAIAWETKGDVSWALLDRATPTMSARVSPPGPGNMRRHPAVAMAGDQILLAWTEGMAWARGGTLHWQGYDRKGTPTAVRGTAPGVPVWSKPAVIARKTGSFTIIY